MVKLNGRLQGQKKLSQATTLHRRGGGALSARFCYDDRPTSGLQGQATGFMYACTSTGGPCG